MSFTWGFDKVLDSDKEEYRKAFEEVRDEERKEKFFRENTQKEQKEAKK